MSELWVKEISNLEGEQSELLLNELYNHALQPAFIYEQMGKRRFCWFGSKRRVIATRGPLGWGRKRLMRAETSDIRAGRNPFYCFY